MKQFRDDFFALYERLKSGKPFSFSKYADGEYGILRGKDIGNAEFRYVNSKNTAFHQRKLIDSFQYKHEDYYVGVGCPCCMRSAECDWMKTFSAQDDDHLTWANIFVNANYPLYKEYMLPEYRKRKIVLVTNTASKIDLLPFSVTKDFRVGHTAFVNDYGMVEVIKKWISENRIKDHLFLFTCGPFGNILSHQLHEHNKDNVYFDIGSTLDPLMGLGNRRGYHGGRNLDKTCIW